ncbi:hypothetical protein, partial [Listeria cornellensis]
MNNKKAKKIISTLTIASVVGASVVTPLNGLTLPTKAAERVQNAASVTAPKYVAPAYKTLVMQDMNVYLPYLSLDGNYLIISMTKIIKNYGVSVTLPNGQIITKFKNPCCKYSRRFRDLCCDMDLRSQPY